MNFEGIRVANLYQNITKQGLCIKNQITSKPISSLALMKGSQLQIYQTHVGRFLKLKVKSAQKLTGIFIWCKDFQDFPINVQVYNFPLNNKPQSHYFYPGRVIYVKQPYFKEALDLQLMVRVDDPSDIQFQTKQSISIEEYRKLGIQLVKKQRYIDAYCLYCQVLEKKLNQQQKVKFLLNKALMCLKINLKGQYGQCAKIALSIDPNNEKAIYHSYKYQTISAQTPNLQNFYDKLDKKIKNEQKLSQTSKSQLRAFLKLQLSFKTNKINWAQAIFTKNLGQYFSSKIQIAKNSFGKGIFAAEDIKPGQFLIIENSLLWSSNFNAESNTAHLDNTFIMKADILRLLKVSKQFSDKFMSLANELIQLKYQTNGNIMGKDLDDVVKRNIYCMHPFQKIILGIKPKQLIINYYLYQKIGIINHRCQFSCELIRIGTYLIVFSIAPISKGQEIFLNYTPEQDYEKRTKTLEDWGFKCNCTMCQEQIKQIKWKQAKQLNSKRLQFLVLKTLIEKKKASSKDRLKLLNFYNIQAMKMMYLDCSNDEMGNKMLSRLFSLDQQQAQSLMTRLKKKQYLQE